MGRGLSDVGRVPGVSNELRQKGSHKENRLWRSPRDGILLTVCGSCLKPLKLPKNGRSSRSANSTNRHRPNGFDRNPVDPDVWYGQGGEVLRLRQSNGTPEPEGHELFGRSPECGRASKPLSLSTSWFSQTDSTKPSLQYPMKP